MAVPNTRAALKEYCLRSLGKPVIDINVDEDQVEDRIDEALQYFAQYHTDGVERMYLKYKVTADDVTRLTKKKSFNADEKGTVAENIELESGTNTQEEGAGDGADRVPRLRHDDAAEPHPHATARQKARGHRK